jgi:hypothetical protein
MKPWKDRPSEVAHLFNPVFSAILLRHATIGYTEQRSTGLPWVFGFLVLPLVLHKSTRHVLPKTKATKFQTWVEKNPAVLIGFAERARHMIPHVREGIMFGVSCGLLVCSEDGKLFAGPRWPKKKPTFESEEVKDCVRKSQSLGAVLATAGAEHTVCAILGVQP